MVSAKIIKRKKFRLSLKRKFSLKKGLHLLPHLFTLGNAFFGFCSVILSAQGNLFAAAYFIFLGALMDALDGRVARFIGCSSDLGVQLDSLGDAISFCLAPAILAYFWQLKQLGFIGTIFCALFLLAGVIRLARFNLICEKQTVFFIGLPSTMAGCFLTTVLLNSKKVLARPDCFLTFIAILTLVLAFLMISTVPFPSFKRKLFNIHKNWYVVAAVMLFAFITVMQLHRVLLLLFLFYFFSAFVIGIKFRGKRS